MRRALHAVLLKINTLKAKRLHSVDCDAIMGIVMVAMLAFGGTFAYFTATSAEITGTAKTGTVKLAANTMATLNATGIVSGSELIKFGKIQVTNESDVDTWIFVTFSASFGAKGANAKSSVAECVAEGDYYLAIAGAEANGWTAVSGATNVYGKKVLASDEKTLDVCSSIKFYGFSQSTADAAGSLMAQDITVAISAKSVQVISEESGELTMADAYNIIK